MKKKIIFPIVVLCLIILLPSHPALDKQHIQPKENILPDQIQFIDFPKDGIIKYPTLYNLLLKWLNFRWKRAEILADISSDSYQIWHFIWETIVYYPILYMRFIMLVISNVLIINLLEAISYKLNWNWEFYTP
jgi:hypothetical protein